MRPQQGIAEIRSCSLSIVCSTSGDGAAVLLGNVSRPTSRTMRKAQPLPQSRACALLWGPRGLCAGNDRRNHHLHWIWAGYVFAMENGGTERNACDAGLNDFI